MEPGGTLWNPAEPCGTSPDRRASRFSYTDIDGKAATPRPGLTGKYGSECVQGQSPGSDTAFTDEAGGTCAQQTCPDPRPSAPPPRCSCGRATLLQVQNASLRSILFHVHDPQMQQHHALDRGGVQPVFGKRQFYASLRKFQLTMTSNIKKSKFRRKTKSLLFSRIIVTCTCRCSEKIKTLHRLWKNHPASFILPSRYIVICSWPLSESRLRFGFFLYSTWRDNRVISEFEYGILLLGPCVYLWKAVCPIP